MPGTRRPRSASSNTGAAPKNSARNESGNNNNNNNVVATAALNNSSHATDAASATTTTPVVYTSRVEVFRAIEQRVSPLIDDWFEKNCRHHEQAPSIMKSISHNLNFVGSFVSNMFVAPPPPTNDDDAAVTTTRRPPSSKEFARRCGILEVTECRIEYLVEKEDFDKIQSKQMKEIPEFSDSPLGAALYALAEKVRREEKEDARNADFRTGLRALVKYINCQSPPFFPANVAVEDVIKAFPFQQVFTAVIQCKSRYVVKLTLLQLANQLKSPALCHERIFISEQNLNLIKDRDGRWGPLHRRNESDWILNRANTCVAAWQPHLDENRVLILSGSSGSGKTVQAVLCAARVRRSSVASNKDDPPNRQALRADPPIPIVTFYLTSADLSRCGWSEELGSNKPVRNDRVHEVVETAIDEVVRSHTPAQCQLVPDRDSQCEIVVILDELGPCPHFLRGLCSQAESLSKKLEKRFFDTETSNRVHFIAAGTGVIVSKGVDPASSQHSFFPQVLDNTPLEFKQFVDLYSSAWTQDEISAAVCNKLRRVSSIVSAKSSTKNMTTTTTTTTAPPQELAELVPAPSSAEMIMASLVKNARCAAICCSLFSNFCTQKTESFVGCCGQVLDDVLVGLLPIVVREYCAVNGLAKFRYPENVLLTALAADAMNLAQLPESDIVSLAFSHSVDPKFINELDLGRFLIPSVQIEGRTLFDILSVTGGVLVDQSCPPEAAASSSSSMQQTNATKTSSSTAAVLRSSRYRFSEPHCAMLYTLLGIPHRPQTCYGFEESIGDCCTLLAAASPFYRLMKNIIDNNNNSPGKKQYQGQSPSSSASSSSSSSIDPLLPLKRCFDFPSATPNQRDGKLEVKYFHSREQLAKKPKGGGDPWSDAKMQTALEGVSAGTTVVVFLSAFQEPFADVVVAAPNRLILIQCKSRSARDTSTVDAVAEIAKMGLHATKSTPAQRSYLQQLVASCRVPKTNGGQVEIEAFILVAKTAKVGNSTFKQSDGNISITATAIKKIDTKCSARATQISFTLETETSSSSTAEFLFYPALPNTCTLNEKQLPAGQSSIKSRFF